MMQEIESIQNGLAHKSFNPNSEQHKEFQLQLQKKEEAVNQILPHINFEKKKDK